jgi:hypothetical protein
VNPNQTLLPVERSPIQEDARPTLSEANTDDEKATADRGKLPLGKGNQGGHEA